MLRTNVKKVCESLWQLTDAHRASDERGELQDEKLDKILAKVLMMTVLFCPGKKQFFFSKNRLRNWNTT